MTKTINRLTNISVVAEVLTPSGETTLVDVAVRDRDLKSEVVLLLLEKASGTPIEADPPYEPLPADARTDFEESDALGG